MSKRILILIMVAMLALAAGGLARYSSTDSATGSGTAAVDFAWRSGARFVVTAWSAESDTHETLVFYQASSLTRYYLPDSAVAGQADMVVTGADTTALDAGAVISVQHSRYGWVYFDSIISRTDSTITLSSNLPDTTRSTDPITVMTSAFSVEADSAVRMSRSGQLFFPVASPVHAKLRGETACDIEYMSGYWE